MIPAGGYNGALFRPVYQLVNNMGALLPILALILIGSTPLYGSDELHIQLLDVGQLEYEVKVLAMNRPRSQ